MLLNIDMTFMINIMIFIFVSLIIAFVVLFFVIRQNKKKKRRKMFSDIESTLDKICNQYKEMSYRLGNNECYDYILQTKMNEYYIKIIPNFDNEEICINSAIKWQLRRSFNDESVRFVEGNEALIRLDIERKKGGKKPVKLFIIYPNARTLLRYINECEMEFVNPDTDIYGTHVVTYMSLDEDINIINKIEKERKGKTKI